MRFKKSYSRRSAKKSYRRSKRRMVKKAVRNRVYNFKRTLTVTIDVVNPLTGFLSGANGLFNYTGMTFDQLPNYTEFTSLFDQYRICRIKTKFIPDYNEAPTGAALGYTPPNLVTVLDNNDANPITGRPQTLQYQTFKERPSYKPSKIYCVPKLATPAYRTGVTWGYSQVKGNPWVDMRNTDVEYYGYKWALFWNTTGTGVERSGKLVMDTTVYFQCRQVN